MERALRERKYSISPESERYTFCYLIWLFSVTRSFLLRRVTHKRSQERRTNHWCQSHDSAQTHPQHSSLHGGPESIAGRTVKTLNSPPDGWTARSRGQKNIVNIRGKEGWCSSCRCMLGYLAKLACDLHHVPIGVPFLPPHETPHTDLNFWCGVKPWKPLCSMILLCTYLPSYNKEQKSTKTTWKTESYDILHDILASILGKPSRYVLSHKIFINFMEVRCCL